MTLGKAYEDAFGIYVPIIIDWDRNDIATVHFMSMRGGGKWYPDEQQTSEPDELQAFQDGNEIILDNNDARNLLIELFSKFVWEEV
jgi:hypothetical protein